MEEKEEKEDNVVEKVIINKDEKTVSMKVVLDNIVNVLKEAVKGAKWVAIIYLLGETALKVIPLFL